MKIALCFLADQLPALSTTSIRTYSTVVLVLYECVCVFFAFVRTRRAACMRLPLPQLPLYVLMFIAVRCRARRLQGITPCLGHLVLVSSTLVDSRVVQLVVKTCDENVPRIQNEQIK